MSEVSETGIQIQRRLVATARKRCDDLELEYDLDPGFLSNGLYEDPDLWRKRRIEDEMGIS